MSKRLVRARAEKFAQQMSCCHYCEQPMWLRSAAEFAIQFHLSLRQALHFQCTAEHLAAKKDGGTADPGNIVAACRRCNLGRHRRKRVRTPEQHKAYVRRQMAQGRWHQVRPRAVSPAKVPTTHQGCCVMSGRPG